MRYLNEKRPIGGDGSNQYTTEQRDKNYPLAKTAKKIADQTGVSEMTVKNDAKFAQAIDLIQKDTPELAQKILKAAPRLAVSRTDLESQNLLPSRGGIQNPPSPSPGGIRNQNM